MVAPVSEAEGHSLSSYCNIIMEGLNRANLPPRIDSPETVQAVYRHVMDRVEGKVPVKRPINDPRQPEKVMNALYHVAAVQGWNQGLVDNWKSMRCMRLLRDRVKQMKKMGNIE